MKAIIMAGGEGSRLRPLTCDCPKPMMRLMDKPVMEYALGLLGRSGITEIAATLGYLPDAVTDYFGDGQDFGVNLRYYIEREPLGTAGGVAQARDFLDETFVVLSGDGVTDLDIMEAVAFHRSRQAEATLVLKRVENPLEYGVVVTEDDGRIRSFHEKPGWGDVLSDAVNTGIYILEPEILQRIPVGTARDFGRELFPQMVQEGCKVYGYCTEAYWCDIGDLSAYLRVHFDAMDGKISLPELGKRPGGILKSPGALVDSTAILEAPCFIAAGAQVYAGAHIGPYTAVGEGAVIRPGASAKHSVLWPGAQLMRGAQARGCVLAANAMLGESAQAFEDSALGTGAAAGAHATIMPGVKLWPEKFVPDGERRDSNLVWGSRKDSGFSAGVLPLGAPAQATRAAQACAAALKPREILLGRTPSAVAGALWHAVAAGLMAQGTQVVDAGVCCMPQLRHVLKGLRSDAAALVEDDRLMLLDGHGARLGADKQRAISALLLRQDYSGPFSGVTPPILSAGRTEISYIAHLASAFAADPADAPEIAMYCSQNHPLSLAEQAFHRANLTIRAEWEPEMMELAPGEVGVWLSPGGETATLADESGALSDAEQQLLVAWVALSLGETTLLLPPGCTDGVRILAEGHGAETETVAGEQARWMQEVSRRFPLQFQLHFDGLFLAISALSAMADAGLSLTQWRAQMPIVHRKTISVPVAPALRGRVLSALARAVPDSQLGGGVRIARDGGWAWISTDEQSPQCRIIAEGMDAEFASELCDFCERQIQQALQPQK